MMQGPSFKLIPIDKIRVGERLRPASGAHVQYLYERIYEDGFSTAITVWQEPGRDDFTLVDGLHRFEAAKLCGIQNIPAMVRAATIEGYDLLLEEATLNLARADLTPYDKASSVAGVYETLLIKAGVAKGESARKLGAIERWKQSQKLPNADENMHGSDQTQASVREQAAKLCGLNIEYFKRYVRIYRNIAPELAEALRNHEGFEILATLLDVARYPASFQGDLATALKNDAGISIKAAIGSLTTSSAMGKEGSVVDVGVPLVSKFSRLPELARDKAITAMFGHVRASFRGEAMAEMSKELNDEQKRGLLSVLADELGIQIDEEAN